MSNGTNHEIIRRLLAMKSVLGFHVAGDLGPLTWYTTASGKIVAYPRSPPTKPPTQRQIQQRLRFRAAREAWLALTPPERNDWNRLTNALHVCMTGINLWISLAMVPRPDQLARAQITTGITVTPPPTIPP